LKEKDNYVPKITHEAEVTRQYARFQIPIQIEIDKKIYNVQDWSLSGCGIIDLPKEYENKFVKARVIFKFNQFETVISDLKLEILYFKGNMAGSRFTDTTPQQISIFNQIITAYLAGDIITQDDILHAVTRINLTSQKKKIDEVKKTKAWSLLALIYLVITILVAFLLFVAYNKIYVIKATNAYVDSNMTIIRSPYPSYIHFKKDLKVDDNITKGRFIAIAKLIGGGFVNIISPVSGKVYKINTKNGEFKNTTEPIVSILDKGAHPFIYATVLYKYAKKIEIGDIAKIYFPNRNIGYAKIENIKFPENIEAINGKPLENVYATSRDYVKIKLTTFIPIDKNLIGTSPVVVFDTFLNRYGFLDENKTNIFTTLF